MAKSLIVTFLTVVSKFCVAMSIANCAACCAVATLADFMLFHAMPPCRSVPSVKTFTKNRRGSTSAAVSSVVVLFKAARSVSVLWYFALVAKSLMVTAVMERSGFFAA